MSNLLQQLKQRVLSTNNTRATAREVELWVHLYAQTKQQQHFAKAMLPSLKQLNSPLLSDAEAIIALDSLLNRTQGILLKKVDQLDDPILRQSLLALLRLP